MFRRTVYLFGAIIAVALTGWLSPASHWPTFLWLPALLVSIFIVGPFMLALDIRDGRRASEEDAVKISRR